MFVLLIAAQEIADTDVAPDEGNKLLWLLVLLFTVCAGALILTTETKSG